MNQTGEEVKHKMPTVKLKAEVFDRMQSLHALTNSALARAMGVDRSTMHRVRSGEVAPSMAFAAGAILALQLPFDALFEVCEADEDHQAA